MVVNANFFAPCCEARPEPKDLVGLAVSNGEVVSPAQVRGRTGDCVLVEKAAEPPPRGTLAALTPKIDAHFGAPNAAEILAGLRDQSAQLRLVAVRGPAGRYAA